MPAETALVLIVVLLWGPTAIWLIYRASRGGEERRFESDDPGSVSSTTWQLTTADRAPLVVEGAETWVCRGCRSLNRRDAKHCYSCRGPRDELDLPVRMARPERPLVPVMAQGSEPPSPTPPPVTPPSLAPPPPTRAAPPPPSGVPWLAASGEQAADRPRFAWDGVPVMADAAADQPAARDGLTVCPFLGLERDPTTWFDFPAPGNVCHASSSQPASLVRSIGRLVSGSHPQQSISIAHQRAACLAVAHVECPRYAAAGGASRTAIQARAAAIQPILPLTPSVVTPEPRDEPPVPAMATVAARPKTPPATSDDARAPAPKARRAKRSR